VKRSAPALPRKKTFGKMSPKFITERKRQLQLYLDALLGDPTCAASEPFKMFLGAESHAAEMDILAKAAIRAADPLEGQAPVLNQWRGADAASLAGVEQAAEQARSTRNLPREARARSQLAVMYSNSGVKDKALEAARVAYTCCRQVQEVRGALAAGTLACCLTWASIHAAFGEYMLAHTRLREAEGLARGGAAPAALGLCLRMRALVHHAQGRPREAAEAAVAALPLLLEGGDFRTLALMQHGLGLVLLGAGEMRQAVEVLESALLFRRRSRDKLGLAETLAALGETFARIGYQLHAMDYFAQALALSQEVGDAAGESICLRSLGRVHHLHGDHSEALASYDRALTLLIRLDDLIGQSECHEGVAGIHLDLGDARMAIVHLKEARSLLSGPGDPHRVPSSGNAGASRDQDGEHEYPNSASSGEEEELSKEMGENRANQGGSAAGTENPRQGQGEREDLHRRLQEKLEAARKLQAETLNAYDEYDRALRQGPVGEVRSADSGGDGLAVPLPGGLASVGVGESAAGKGKSPRFPIKFKLKMPGQDFASHLKFLQSWSQHKRYYTGGAAGADEPDDES
jgi:tetratricopeptide (TPR) repeat protein